MNHPTNQPDNNCPTGSTAAAPSADTAQQHQQQQPCPDWLHLCAELKEEACWKDQWEQLGSFAEGEHKATYQAQSFVRELYGYRLRFVVVHSDQLEA